MTAALMAVEADREAVSHLPVDVALLASLRETARLLSTHHSTQIEGNRLSRDQVQQVLGGARIPDRQRDEHEVRCYYAALQDVDRLALTQGPLTEADVQRIHALAFTGRPAPTPYRDGQNVIRDSRSGALVYLPPQAADIPPLMADLLAWIRSQLSSREIPVPLVAACAHYQFATIHPYYDGNGRTARLLTTLILHRGGYGLKGIYSLDEYYARDLLAYYRALSIGPSHNYYAGRADADVTPFLEYFLLGMADAFAKVRLRASEAADRGAVDHSPLLRRLDPRQRRLLALFRRSSSVAVTEIAAELGLSPRTVRPLCTRWVAEGFLILRNPSRRLRLYALAPQWENELTREAPPLSLPPSPP